MQDISDPTGSQTIAKIAGQEVLLGGFTFEDIGTIQGELLKAKRKAILQTALVARDILPPDEAAKEWEAARDKASRVEITGDDFDKYMKAADGVATMLWILCERQHPGRFTRAEILKSLNAGELTDDKALELLQTLEALQQVAKK